MKDFLLLKLVISFRQYEAPQIKLKEERILNCHLKIRSEFKLNLPPKAHKQHIKTLFATKPGEIKEFVSDGALSSLRLKRI